MSDSSSRVEAAFEIARGAYAEHGVDPDAALAWARENEVGQFPYLQMNVLQKIADSGKIEFFKDDRFDGFVHSAGTRVP